MSSVESLPSIFISYSRADSEFVDKLETELSKHGFVTWLDRQHLEGGNDWAAVIQAQITRHELVVVVLSPDAVASEWVNREIAFAQQIRKDIVPVLAKTTQVPFRISELQFVDFTRDFATGAVQLRTALSKPRTATPSSKKQPPAYTPPTSIQQDILVDIPAPPSEPPPDLEMLYMQARSAFAREDWDTAEALLSQVVTKDPTYDEDAAASYLATARKNLIPVQINRLKTKADAAHRAGQWGEEIACWNAIEEIESYHREARERHPIAEQNQRAQRIYKRAGAFAKAKDLIAARKEIERLKTEAPYYGDPDQIGQQIGVTLAANYLGYQDQQERERQAREQQAKEQQVREEQAQTQRVRAEQEQRLAREAAEAKQQRRIERSRAIRSQGKGWASWGVLIGLFIGPLLFTSFTNTQFDIGKSWVGLLAGFLGYVLSGGILSLYGAGIEIYWGKRSTKFAIFGCVFFGGVLGLVINAIGSSLLLKISYPQFGQALYSGMFVGAMLGIFGFFWGFNHEGWRGSGTGCFTWISFTVIFTLGDVTIYMLEQARLTHPEVEIYPSLVGEIIICLSIYIFLRIVNKLTGFNDGLPFFFFISGTAIGEIGCSVWGYAIELHRNSVAPIFFSAMEGLVIGGLSLALLGWAFGAVLAVISYMTSSWSLKN